MRVKIEPIYIAKCDRCSKTWELLKEELQVDALDCPRCEHQNPIEGFQNPKGEPVQAIGWVKPTVRAEPLVYESIFDGK